MLRRPIFSFPKRTEPTAPQRAIGRTAAAPEVQELNPSDYEVLGSYYLVRLLDPETVLPSGLELPREYMDQRSEGVILGKGPGKVYDWGGRQLMHYNVGDYIGFEPVGAAMFSHREHRIAVVHADSLRTVRFAPDFDTLYPCNDFLLIEPDQRPTQIDGTKLAQSDEFARRPCRGVVLGVGPGKPLPNWRLPVATLMGFHGLDLVGQRLCWERDCDFIEVANANNYADRVLIKAENCLALEVQDGE